MLNLSAQPAKAGVFIANFVLVLGFYMLLAGSLSPSELLAGSALAALLSALATLLPRWRTRDIKLAAPPALITLCLLGSLLRETFMQAGQVGAVLLYALVRRPVGRAYRQNFQGTGETPLDAGRRGLVILGVSFAPNGYVLDLTEDKKALLVHRLWPGRAGSARSGGNERWPI